MMTPIHTIGYGSRSLPELLELLQSNGIDCLVDVRSAPYSRYRPEFSRQPLECFLKEAGIRYVFLGEGLGGRPDDPTCYESGRVVYERVMLREAYRRGIERLRAASERGMRVALLCSEGKPEECHRSKLIGVTLAGLGIPLVHLDEKGEPQSQEEVLRRLTAGQLDLFGESGFASRKRYAAGEDDGA